MAGWAARTAVRGSLAQIRHVVAVPPERAEGLVAEVYRQVERDFGLLAPPVALHSPAPESLAAAWLMLRETLVASGRADRSAKETVASGVSHANSCPYCVDVHSTMLHGLIEDRDAAAIAEGDLGLVGNLRLRRLAIWARGDAGPATVGATAAMPSTGEASELIGVAVTFHYLNRMVNIFLGPSPIPERAPSVVRSGLRRLLGRVVGRTARQPVAPGAALSLLPAAPLAADLVWAEPSDHVGAAFARAAAAIDELGARVVAEPVRDLVTAFVAAWDGAPTGPSRSWVGEVVAVLPPVHRAAAVLAILTACASYQVDDGVIGRYREQHPGAESLLGLTAWASLVAARRMGALLGVPPASAGTGVPPASAGPTGLTGTDPAG